jgi:hypothetical protein
MSDDKPDKLSRLFSSAARLQELVPHAVLVGGAAVSYYTPYRYSVDHDHVVSDLGKRFEMVLSALEDDPEWVTNQVKPGKIILGELGDIEVGVRQLIRKRPLETSVETLANGQELTVPTLDETVRIKAYLIVKRNRTRDYLDVAALADKYGISETATLLSNIDEYYSEDSMVDDSVARQLLLQLSDPKPQDSRAITQLANYKGIDPKYADWSYVTHVLHKIAKDMEL